MEKEKINWKELEKNEAWSPQLKKRFGKHIAAAFVNGSEILLDHINEDDELLKGLPKGTTLSGLEDSMLLMYLPECFADRYDRKFLADFRENAEKLIKRATQDKPLYAHSVADELALYMIMQIAQVHYELMGYEIKEGTKSSGYWDEWVFDIFDDADIEMFLYENGHHASPGDTYHFNGWFELQFHMSQHS